MRKPNKDIRIAISSSGAFHTKDDVQFEEKGRWYRVREVRQGELIVRRVGWVRYWFARLRRLGGVG